MPVRTDDKIRCSFCGKTQDQVKKLIAGSNNVYICDECIDLCAEILEVGVMKENEPLPSVRALAMDLSINPNTIQRAYVELERQGYIYTVKGKGSFVADNTVMKEKRKKEVLLQVSDMIDEAIRVGIPGDEIKNMVEIQYKAAKRNGGGEA